MLAGAAALGAPRGFGASAVEEPTKSGNIVVFVARKIVTMNPDVPTATAVAVRDGAILGVGSIEDLAPWLKGRQYTIDKQFEDKVLMPGFIDPHLHPMLGAIGFEASWVTPEAWDVMGAQTPATSGHTEYVTRLKAAFDADSKNEPIFMSWGYSQFYHGEMSKAILDAISSKRPILVLQRSMHEIYLNTPMMEYVKEKGFDVNKAAHNPQIDLDTGHFWEDGMFSGVLPYIAEYLLHPVRVDKGFQRIRDYMNYNGITTCADLATGSVNWEFEMAGLRRNFDTADSPVRVRITPDVRKIGETFKSSDKALALVAALEQKNTKHIVFNHAIKLFADGAMFSQNQQVLPPGYIDGHVGQWITPPAEFEDLAQKYWNAGYQIHVHTNGDGGAKMVLDTLQKIQTIKFRPDHRFTIEHYGFATDSVSERVVKLGAQVCGNPFYVYDLGDLFSEVGLGHDRAATLTPLGGVANRGAAVGLHSDFPMAPSNPLYLAWCAATRETMSGKVLAPNERLTLDQAIRAITIDAAYIIHMEDQIGSIQSGKLADFAVLDKDPYEVGIEGLRKINVWGVVFEGRPFKAKSPGRTTG
ncbi:MAG: amidohydrolase [Pseudomonadota bacterium]|nr:amidohydrolase [Pseudomonadota bacterium]